MNDASVLINGYAAVLALLLAVPVFALTQKWIYRRHWHKGLSYRLNMPKDAAFEGQTITVHESLTNSKKLPLPWVHVSYVIPRQLMFLNNVNQRIPLGERRSLLYAVGAGRTVSRNSKLLCAKRGYYPIREFTLSANNLLMSEFSQRELDCRYAVTVYPRLVDFPETVVPFRKLSGPILARRFTNPDPFEFKGIREYQPTDNFRQINWPAAARTGELMSNVYDCTVSQDVTVLLNLQEYCEYDRDYVHEEAIRLAAFYCRRFAGLGIPVSLVCPSRTGEPVRIGIGLSREHLLTMYTALAHIDLTAYRESVAAYFPTGYDQACILISSHADDALRSKFHALREKGADAAWIAPLGERDATPEGADAVRWEVPRDA